LGVEEGDAMKGISIFVALCVSGCMAIRSDRFAEQGDSLKNPTVAAKSTTEGTSVGARTSSVEQETTVETEAVQDAVEARVEVKVMHSPAALIATRSMGSGEIPALGRKGAWHRLVWTNGFELLVATSEFNNDEVWYQVATFQNGERIALHSQLMDDPENESSRMDQCDTLAPVSYVFDGPAIGIGVECYNEGGDNNYQANRVMLYRVDNPPATLDDLTLLTRITTDADVTGYYENTTIQTKLELRGNEIWRTDLMREGLSEEEESQGIQRKTVTTTTSEMVTTL